MKKRISQFTEAKMADLKNVNISKLISETKSQVMKPIQRDRRQKSLPGTNEELVTALAALDKNANCGSRGARAKAPSQKSMRDCNKNMRTIREDECDSSASTPTSRRRRTEVICSRDSPRLQRIVTDGHNQGNQTAGVSVTEGASNPSPHATPMAQRSHSSPLPRSQLEDNSPLPTRARSEVRPPKAAIVTDAAAMRQLSQISSCHSIDSVEEGDYVYEDYDHAVDFHCAEQRGSGDKNETKSDNSNGEEYEDVHPATGSYVTVRDDVEELSSSDEEEQIYEDIDICSSRHKSATATVTSSSSPPTPEPTKPRLEKHQTVADDTDSPDGRPTLKAPSQSVQGDQTLLKSHDMSRVCSPDDVPLRRREGRADRFERATPVSEKNVAAIQSLDGALCAFPSFVSSTYSLASSSLSSGVSELSEDSGDSEESPYMSWTASGMADEEVDEQDARGTDSDIYMNVEDSAPHAPEPSTRLHRIANEFLTTEETYVSRLRILHKVRTETERILGDAVAKELFPSVDGIYNLHKDNMLPYLRERLLMWNSHQCLGDIIKRFAPFLKIYTAYVSNFEVALRGVDSWLERSTEYFRALSEIPELTKGDRLNFRIQLQSMMLEPIQRVPRIELLLKQYMKYLPDDSPDRPDCEIALHTVSEAAGHFESTMQRGSQLGELVGLQEQIEGPMSVVCVGRRLLKAGSIRKVCTTTDKVVARYAFLFNDLFLLCKELIIYRPGSKVKFKVKQIMEMDGMEVREGDNLDISHTFYVKTRRAVTELCGETNEEKTAWYKALDHAIEERMKEKLQRTPTLNKTFADGWCPAQDLGRTAPKRMHQWQVPRCMMCNAEFTAFRKKRQCRACGSVVCTKCSQHRKRLEYDENRPNRVCDDCYMRLNNEQRTFKAASTGQILKDGKCTFSGQLSVSSDKGNTWCRRWFKVHEAGILNCYRLQQDVRPVASVDLSDTDTQLLLQDSGDEDFVVQIEFPETGKTYFLRSDTNDTMRRCMNAIEKHKEHHSD